MIKTLRQIIKNPYFWEIFLIVILSFTPLLWYKPGSIALGHDMGFPIEPISHFTDRLSVWTERYAFGLDQSGDIGAVFTVHGLEAFLRCVGFSLLVTQKIIFIFWMFAPSLGMYLLARYLYPQPRAFIFRLFATVFYMFNHFSLQAWFIAERTKFSAMTALPLVILILFKFFEERWSPQKAGVAIGIILTIFNAGGFMPLYGSFAIAFSLGLIFFSLDAFIKKDIKEIIRTLKFAFVSFFSFILLNAYWIFPQISLFSRDYSKVVQSIGGMDSLRVWLAEISKNSSYLNLFRLRGVVDWYDNLNHPYANFFLENKAIDILIFALPILAFSAVILAKKGKEKKRISFFSLLFLVGIVFAAGSHPPLEEVYLWLFKHMPGFAIFRTPFYKFGPLLWLSYAFLIGHLLSQTIGSLRGKVKYILTSAVLALILFYNFPYFTGSFFNWNPPLATMVQLPKYVQNFATWVNKEMKENTRIFLVPRLSNEFRANVYQWGYWSLSPLTSLLSNRSFVANFPVLPDNELVLINKLYDDLWNKNEEDALHAIETFNIGYLLLCKDVFYNLKNNQTENPADWQQKIADISWLKEQERFGEWILYKVKNSVNLCPNVYVKTVEPEDTGGSLPEIEVRKWLPTLYQVKVYKSSEPFILVLNQRFSPLWQIATSESQHFKFNGYANAWQLNKKDDYTVFLEYKPQRLFMLGLIVSVASIVVLVLYKLCLNAKKS